MSKRVLVVEDEFEIRQLIVMHLRSEGFDVDELGDGEQARQILTTSTYDLLILDWMLPSLSGLELCRWLRKRGAQVGWRAAVDALRPHSRRMWQSLPLE